VFDWLKIDKNKEDNVAFRVMIGLVIMAIAMIAIPALFRYPLTILGVIAAIGIAYVIGSGVLRLIERRNE